MSNNGLFVVSSLTDRVLNLSTVTLNPSVSDEFASGAKIARPTAGSFLTDGFTAGQTIRVFGTAGNDGTYTVQQAAAGVVTLVAGSNLAAETAQPLIATPSGGSFIDEGFVVGQTVQVTGGGGNSGTFVIQGVSAGSLTLTNNVGLSLAFAPGAAISRASAGATVDAANDLLVFSTAHNFKTGDVVRYDAAGNAPITRRNGSALGAGPYTVEVVDSTRLRLIPFGTVLASTSGFSGGNVNNSTREIDLGGGSQPFGNGQAVTYVAPGDHQILRVQRGRADRDRHHQPGVGAGAQADGRGHRPLDQQ